jgi:hypothetical protein
VSIVWLFHPAHWQTGAGKTYTMVTSFSVSDNPCDFGVVPRVVEDLFAMIAGLAGHDLHVTVRVSYLEIYNEQVGEVGPCAWEQQHDTIA